MYRYCVPTSHCIFSHFLNSICTLQDFLRSFRWRSLVTLVRRLPPGIINLYFSHSELQGKHKRSSFSLFRIVCGLSIFSETPVVF